MVLVILFLKVIPFWIFAFASSLVVVSLLSMMILLIDIKSSNDWWCFMRSKKNSFLVVRVDDEMKSCLVRISNYNLISVGSLVRKILSSYLGSRVLIPSVSRHD